MSHGLQAHGSSGHSAPWPCCPLREHSVAVGQASSAWAGWSRREPQVPQSPGEQHQAGPRAGISPSTSEMWQPAGHIPSSKWLPVIMSRCCVQRCGWDPWLGWIPSFKGKQNKMSLLVLKEAAIISVICLDLKFRCLPKSLCG